MRRRHHRKLIPGLSPPRWGGSTMFLVVGSVVMVLAIGALFWIFTGFSEEDDSDAPLLATVTRGSFQHLVLASGEIESARNVDVRCEVRARGASGPSTTILDVISEGTIVQPGDWLMTLDSSVLEQEKLAEQVVLNSMESDMIKAKAAYDAALFDKEEFEARGLDRIQINLTSVNLKGGGGSQAQADGGSPDGTAGSGKSSSLADRSSSSEESADQPADQPASGGERSESSVATSPPLVNPSYGELKQFIENELSVANFNLRGAQLSFESTRRKVAQGLVDSTFLQSERFRLDAARNVRELAEQKLAALTKHTRQKLLVQLRANFEAAEVGYRSARRSYEEQLAKVAVIDNQMEKCRVLAPAAGQVVYKNVQSRREGSEFVVEPGAAVRQNQVIITLPDPTAMQVKTLVEESRINLLRTGMPATVRIDAFRSVHRGEVSKVNEFAESTNWFNSSSSKQYLTLIRLLDLPQNIRAGLTAEVSLIVETRQDALQMPFQAVYERLGKTFCLVAVDGGWETREIVVSATNEKTVVVDEDASEPIAVGDRVAMNPSKHVALFDQSRFPEAESEQTNSERN